MKKLCYIATIPAVVNSFLRGHIQAAAIRYEMTVICNSTDKHLVDGLNARLILLPIERKPSVLKDLKTLMQLFLIFRREKFDIVHSIMPKTGMLAMLAAWTACVPIRIHTFTGQVWVTKHGVRRFLYIWFDKLIAIFASCVLTDSASQRDFLVNEGVLPKGKAKIIGAGSICGVDPTRFHPDTKVRNLVRNELGISHESKVILYVGRLNREKGVLDLAIAFNRISKQYQYAELLLVGSEEDVHFEHLQDICNEEHARLHKVKFTSMPERYMMAADVFCLPSYREGFGLTIIEAAACGIPTVASRIYGIIDAIADEKTGLLFKAGDVDTLTERLLLLLTDNNIRKQIGNAAYTRALELFSSDKITNEMVLLYDSLSKESL